MPAKARDFKKLSLIGLGLGLLVLVPLPWFFPTPGEEEEDRGENKVFYWHCPNCGLEMACPPGAEAKAMPCPHCVHQGVTFDVQEHRNGQNLSLPGFTGGLLLKVTITALALLIASLLLFGQLRPSQRARREAPVGSAAQRRAAASAKQQEVERWMESMRRRRRTS